MRKEPYIVLDLTAGQVFEHICLESDDVITAARRDGRMGPSFRFVSRVLRRETELAFITDHRLTVRLRRRRKPMRQHIVDLRFIDADAIVERRFDWRTLLAASALAGLGALTGCVAVLISELRWQQVGIQSSFVLAAAAVLAGIVPLYRHLSTFELRSVHGDARLVRVMGGLGDSRTRQAFIAELSGRVEAARGKPRSTQQFLCDEMREHHRLWNEGVLSDVGYETSKRRILAAHA